MGRVGLPVLLVLLAASGGPATAGGPGGEGAGARPLPPPVQVRPEPEGVALGDPAFQPLPGARAEFGRLGGSVYQVEVPDALERPAGALPCTGTASSAPTPRSRRRASAAT